MKKNVLCAAILAVSIPISVANSQTLEVDNTCGNRTVLNVENICYWLLKYKVLHPSIVLKQSILETANFTSNICKENNNLFGMKLPRKRKTVATGENRKHATYNNWIESIEDYKLYQEHFKNTIKNSSSYYVFLKKAGYCEMNYYVRVLKGM